MEEKIISNNFRSNEQKGKNFQVNEEIRDKEIRVIDNDGTQLGIMSPAKAIEIAESKNLDLIKISPMATPPVCKILDYGKYIFELNKKEKENRKNQKIIETKEVRLNSTIDVGDFNVKVKQCRNFLQSGAKVKVSAKMVKRTIVHPELTLKLLDDFMEKVQDLADVVQKPVVGGRFVNMLIAPKNNK